MLWVLCIFHNIENKVFVFLKLFNTVIWFTTVNVDDKLEAYIGLNIYIAQQYVSEYFNKLLFSVHNVFIIKQRILISIKFLS